MYPALAVLLLVLAGFTLLVVRRRGRGVVSEEALGFAYVGAAGTALLAVAVVLVGRLAAVPGRAEGLALLGFAAYVIYLLVAWLVIRFLRARERPEPNRGSSPPVESTPVESTPVESTPVEPPLESRRHAPDS